MTQSSNVPIDSIAEKLQLKSFFFETAD